MTMRPLLSTVLSVCTFVTTLSFLSQDAKATETLAFEPGDLFELADGERFKRPDFSSLFATHSAPICKVAQSPEDGAFVAVDLFDGQGFEFYLSNDSDIGITVLLEAKDASGEVQGSLIVQLGPDENRRVSLIFWAPEGAMTSRAIQTIVRSHPSNQAGDYSLELSQLAVSQRGGTAKVAQDMDCSANGCSLRPNGEASDGALRVDEDFEDPGSPGGGPSGPH